MLLRQIVICCVLALAGVVCAADPPELARGIAAVSVGDYLRATLLLQSLATAHPADSVPNYWLGRAYYGQRQFRAAVKYLGVAANADSGNRDVCLWDARALRAAGKGQAAADAYALLVARYPDDAMLLGEYGAALAQSGDYAGARATFAQLLTHNPTEADRAAVAAWNKALDGLSTRDQLEPTAHLRTKEYELSYDANDRTVDQVSALIERTITRTKNCTGIQLHGFRVLLFPTWESYKRYAMVFLPQGTELYAAAFTLPGLLVFWSPGNWPPKPTVSEEFTAIVRHEMIHLALYQHTGGESFPTWLNEGMACYFGGWGGMQGGQIPAKPLTLNDLDAAFVHADMDGQEHAYAQAHAMVTVLANQLGTERLLQFLDKVVDGVPIATAYEQLNNDKFATFLTEWPARFTALKQQQ